MLSSRCGPHSRWPFHLIAAFASWLPATENTWRLPFACAEAVFFLSFQVDVNIQWANIQPVPTCRLTDHLIFAPPPPPPPPPSRWDPASQILSPYKPSELISGRHEPSDRLHVAAWARWIIPQRLSGLLQPPRMPFFMRVLSASAAPVTLSARLDNCLGNQIQLQCHRSCTRPPPPTDWTCLRNLLTSVCSPPVCY